MIQVCVETKGTAVQRTGASGELDGMELDRNLVWLEAERKERMTRQRQNEGK